MRAHIAELEAENARLRAQLASNSHAMNHDAYPDSYIRGILNTVKTIAMVGFSPKENRPSYFVFKYLLERGYRVIPVNPGQAGKEVLGQKIYASLSDIPEPIDMVDIFRGSENVLPIVEEALTLYAEAAGDLDAAHRAQRRGGQARRRRGHESGDEPLPEDRIWPPVERDFVDRRQFAHTVVEARQSGSARACRRWRSAPADEEAAARGAPAARTGQSF